VDSFKLELLSKLKLGELNNDVIGLGPLTKAKVSSKNILNCP
jgi:hypothetical protein